jgi:hypothetical protein
MGRRSRRGQDALLAILVCLGACRGKPPTHADAPIPSSALPAASATPSASSAVTGTAVPGIDVLLRAMGGAPHELADCGNAELRACLAPFIKPKLAPADIRGLADARCFKSAGDALTQAGDCLPLRVGADGRNGKALSFAFVCSDVCPNQGSVSFRYEHVDDTECCKLGGEPDYIWPHSYAGCSPADSLDKRGIFYASPDDGRWYHVRGSNCPERKPLIVAEWPCEPGGDIRAALGVIRGPPPAGARYASKAQIFPATQCGPHFDAALAERAAVNKDMLARQCLRRLGSGQATIEIRFVASGKVTKVSVSAPARLNETEQRCVERTFRVLSIAPFGDARGELVHQVTLWSDFNFKGPYREPGF